jgi:hypothetical protein
MLRQGYRPDFSPFVRVVLENTKTGPYIMTPVPVCAPDEQVPRKPEAVHIDYVQGNVKNCDRLPTMWPFTWPV